MPNDSPNLSALYRIVSIGGIERDRDGFMVEEGHETGVVLTFEAQARYPAAARRVAEDQLRARGISWDGYADGGICSWTTRDGVIRLVESGG